MRRALIYRQYYVSIANNIEKTAAQKEKIDFTRLHHSSKVPEQPIRAEFQQSDNQEVEIDVKTIQVLERLSLVNLDGEEALRTLKSSIQFAKKIEGINTDDIKPLYTVLENHPLQLREDEVNDGNYRGDILRNAKLIEEDYFISPPGNIPIKQE